MSFITPICLPNIEIWRARAKPFGNRVRITYCPWSDYKLDFDLAEADVDKLLADLVAAKEQLNARAHHPT